MTNRIDRCFETLAEDGKTALIPFVTVGDPHPDWAVDVMHALVEGGSDLLELGVPFSDPTADGPVIQQASERAIAKGVSLCLVLDVVHRFRKTDAGTPIVLMGYLNPIERYGYEAFAKDASAAGVDGLLLVDCPPEELSILGDGLGQAGIHPICLVAPTTTEERMERIGQLAGGYLYYVSFKGITGANRLDAAALAKPLKNLRRHASVPLAVGFGIKDAQSAAEVAAVADGVVIGSALVTSLSGATSAADACERAKAFLAPIRAAMDNSAP
ncbi:MAG: tryptophan synthase subunit alpha [Xanthomonadales bacterium]|nr:tryptophan synthase subunit alpha [Gammaproteobacteria bacterium]MBT8051256.1 tryptophan synthase subunit alpha [Gammaproteobacteria bacterium]MBT8056648.1 tryptophan synthase subunit alpha [Gammaproteobacteria bacterium]NNJ80527.1 tryptophan synthase subunit alpha [Xanthomonadales bacterium]NNL03910.1 tryptophan synthase subunit alpha [Xanthomonadales bacterium]